MTDIKDTPDNPPAFPNPSPLMGGFAQEGMTLRDYFAAAALTGMCGNGDTWPRDNDGPIMAQKAYAYADCMLALRSR